LEFETSSTQASGVKQLINKLIGHLRLRLGDQLADKLLGPGLWALVIKVASAATSYIMLVAFARMLDSKDYGYFGVMLNISIVISAVMAFGLPTGVARFWAGHLAQGEKSLARGFHIGAQKFMVAISVIAIVLGIAMSALGWGNNIFGTVIGATLVALLAVLLSFEDYYANALRAQEKLLWSMLPRDILWRLLSPLLAFVFLRVSGALDAGQAIAICAFVMAIAALAQAYVSAKATTALTGHTALQTDWPKWTRTLVPLAGASILFAMVQQLDVVVVGAFVGAEDAGAYFAAQKTASLLGLVMIAGGLVAAPLMAAAYHSGRKRDLQKLCKMLALAITATTLCGFVLMIFMGKFLLSIFDPAYVSAYPLLLILALGYALDALAGPTAYLMQMTSLETAYLRIMAVVYGFVLAVQITFVPLFGPIAAAIATALGVCLWNGIAIYQLRHSIGVDSSILSFFLPPQQTDKRETS
jgi:O-antigen/teichoic acid export membrane protein